ncbi:hypothetical protein C4D60_Mb08t15730 [Musa balbisiana]|uniref:C3H1-type domain-containing protein n=1 Tax=Musa balbisiana TaxID=52838 RepID=A0A4S8K431_MUSBA|nr:hypothetical protein C4D60_Mb08t15730 [Musa balbisiana]
MPPKGQPSKAELAKKQKIVEDKTFGLKNKNKSKNVQKYVQSLQQSVQPKPDSSKIAAKKKKEEDKAREKELNDLFKIAVSQPKVPVGVDPKSILCEFFKVGQCQKGFKCKFSHDLNVQRKGEKIDLYSDQRDRDQGTMEDWDQEMLEKVVETKNKEYNQNKPTDIVCKYFLDAVEKKQYGWFWVCPNGGKDCHYRHALPPGYRAKVSTSTPLTPELFTQWKRKKMEEREADLAAMRADRAKNDRMSGRELFLSDSSLFVDDDEAYEKYNREEQPESTEKCLVSPFKSCLFFHLDLLGEPSPKTATPVFGRDSSHWLLFHTLKGAVPISTRRSFNWSRAMGPVNDNVTRLAPWSQQDLEAW